MECPICLNKTDTISMSSRCLHGTCKDCSEKLRNKSCYYCRDTPNPKRIDLNASIYEAFIVNESPTQIEPFDVLFGTKYRETYNTIKKVISSKWNAVSTHTFSTVCGVCLLSHAVPEVDLTLLTLFYSCSPITQTTVMDAMVCTAMLYGLRRSINVITPIGVYFHFFLNHCTAVRGVNEEDQSHVCDFVTKIMHALVYDVPEVDALSNFINTNPSDATSRCPCNTAQKSLDAISGKSELGDDKEDEGGAPFVPDGIARKLREPVVWANSYKWKQIDSGVNNVDTIDDSTVNFFSVFSDCVICNEMMDSECHARLRDLDRAICFKRNFMNVATAVSVVCQSEGKTYTANMIKHYTDPGCELNRLKFIHFYSLVKQPHSLMGKSAAPAHLLSELFSSKRSHVCPTYHLACFSYQIISADDSQLKKTKRDSIQKWAHKIIKRHTQAVAVIPDSNS